MSPHAHTHSITRASKHMIPIYSWGYSCVLAAFSNMAVTRDKTGKQLHLPANSRSKCQLGKGQDHSWPPSGSLSPGRESTLPWTQGNYSLVSIQKKRNADSDSCPSTSLHSTPCHSGIAPRRAGWLPLWCHVL